MSKTSLKKELLNMDKNQLVELILDVYCARKEAKEYFEFFLDPDVAKLQDKYEQAVSKEFNRVKRGYCKARISVLKNQLKEFASFQPGFEAEIELMLFVVRYALMVESHIHFPDTLLRGVAVIMRRLVEVANSNYVADSTLERLGAMLSDSRLGSRYFRRYLSDELASCLAEAAPEVKSR